MLHMVLSLADEIQRLLADKDVAHMSRPTHLNLFWKWRDAAIQYCTQATRSSIQFGVLVWQSD